MARFASRRRILATSFWHDLVPPLAALPGVDGGLVMTGYVDSSVESENIRSLAATFIGKDDKLVNMLNSAGSRSGRKRLWSFCLARWTEK